MTVNILYFPFDLHVRHQWARQFGHGEETHALGLLPMDNRKAVITKPAIRYCKIVRSAQKDLGGQKAYLNTRIDVLDNL